MEQSYLRFSLEESVWFKRGQEVAEFLSISLDPVISVDEYDQYITIRGALELNGEFRQAGEGLVEADDDVFELAGYRFIQHISVREDGISELSHRFPIDITIPKNRIRSLEDVYVTVESFDYDLDENGRLLITADISISGISEAPLGDDLPDDEEDDEPLFAPFESIARKEAAGEEAFASVDDLADEADEQPALAAGETTVSVMEPAALRHEETGAEEEEAKEPFLPLETETKVVSAQTEEDIASLLPPTEAKVSIGAAKKAVEEEEEEETKTKSENALYLTKLFAKSEAEEFTKLKICIVQQGDSLDKIAERYDVTVSQLLRANDLESPDDVHEGQLLYIPAMAGSRPFS
ncbi:MULTISPECIES: stage VI sporulation protein D [Geobacillus]|uniref:Stage VI sporulation protein D n=1 Tax=Geobacillus proteiniphilus TaxID=860353 RepID=A0A1Q5TAE7_9BACL|nr:MULTISPECIES: stage VI sporulation protein D [Geobacillus]KDE47453.1 stage VI sporulation protein D [Geobacillus sp. CAMR5420]MED3722020.1 stage VI sporulation protein D [Geobacillus stearothermophilus]MED3747738.1 stage VI sporulation protein D [Geobacillus stearothermophilus]MED3752363.1 stage VI sporulation protein D [Geobacillus stearothermophilus]MED3768467.1 stage VI sporulation protein D [Geobacillus stearothermophilus]